jgi:hypothetical protein
MSENQKDVKNTEDFLSALVGTIQLQQSRALREGPWCFFCGYDQAIATCACSLSESLQCVGHRLCWDCRSAHRFISAHIKKMFAARVVDRVSSIRAKLFNQLHSAAETLDEASGKPFEKQLHFALGQADPYDCERAEFRQAILAAFGSAKFTAWQQFAKELENEQDQELKMRLARYFSSCAF